MARVEKGGKQKNKPCYGGGTMEKCSKKRRIYAGEKNSTCDLEEKTEAVRLERGTGGEGTTKEKRRGRNRRSARESKGISNTGQKILSLKK